MSYGDDKNKGISSNVKISVSVVGSIIVFIVGAMWTYPKYNVYSSQLAGEASLKQAQYDRQIAVAEAHAKMESAKLLADSEVIRAEGVAKANQIIGDSLKGNEVYLKYLWVNNLENSKNQVIYIPTEANIPLLEAGKRK